MPRRPYDDALDADGANRLRSRIVDDAVRIADLEDALREIAEFTADAPNDDPLSHVHGTASAALRSTAGDQIWWVRGGMTCPQWTPDLPTRTAAIRRNG